MMFDQPPLTVLHYLLHPLIYFRKEKEIMKALETPEEKRARRLAKKEAKERKRRQKLGWDSEQLVSKQYDSNNYCIHYILYQEYTNTNNPFGDHHLLEKFVWHKVNNMVILVVW